jgi:pimeloyl-ACP methyl ester carboxylesterase
MHVEHTAESGTKFAVTEIGALQGGGWHLVWGHGWGQSGAAMTPIAEALRPFGHSSLIDFPGFGKSPLPPGAWGTAEYADLAAEWLKGLAHERVVWIGHSFGGRIGLQLAARHPDLLAGMVLIAAAGLQRQRSLAEKLRFTLRRTAFKTARRFTPEGPRLDALRKRFGSSDYQSAGALRPVFVRVVGEDLTEVARAVRCPTLLIYGAADTETPPEMGQRLHRLIAGSELTILDGFNHLSVLSEGRHQVALRIRKFLERIEA